MLKVTIKPGEYIQIGKEIKVIFAGGTGNNMHLMIDAPRELNIARSKLLEKRETYYVDQKLPREAVKQIQKIIMENKLPKPEEGKENAGEKKKSARKKNAGTE